MKTQINKRILKRFLYQMKRIRIVEETIAARYCEGKMRCPTHLCSGQEAVAVGTCAALRADDFVLSTHRSHGHYLAKGGSLRGLIAEIYGKTTGCSAGKGGSMHLIDEKVRFMGSTSIVGGTIPVGTGIGLSIQLNGKNQISCVFLGDGAVEEGVFYESLNFAVLKKLPVLYICENNLYAVYSPLSVRQPDSRKIFEMVRGLGIRSSRGDGNDIIDVYAKSKEAVNYIIKRNGPFFIEFMTYRFREHCGPNYDNDLGYRTEKEYAAWRKKDPIIKLENIMIAEKMITASEIGRIEREIEREISGAFEFAEQSPFPEAADAFSKLFK